MIPTEFHENQERDVTKMHLSNTEAGCWSQFEEIENTAVAKIKI